MAILGGQRGLGVVPQAKLLQVTEKLIYAYYTCLKSVSLWTTPGSREASLAAGETLDLATNHVVMRSFRAIA